MAINPTDLARPGDSHVGSYWAATGGAEVAGASPVAGDIDVEVAVIGGGYTGLSAAYHLARDHGVAAHVLEAHRIGWGCSGRNGGFCSIGLGKEDFGAWVARWGIDEAKRVFEQGREAVRTVQHILEREAIDAEPSPQGGLELAHKPNRMAGMAARQKLLRETFGIEARLLSRDELRRDYLASEEAHGALIHDEGFGLHPLRYVRGLARAAQQHGAVLHAASPVTAWRKDGSRHLLSTPGGTVRAKQVVIATNGYTNDTLHPATRGRLLPALSSIIVTRPLSRAERDSVAWQTYLKIWDSRRLLFYYRLLPDDRVMFGSRGGIEDTASGAVAQKAWMQRRLAEMFPPLARVETEYFWRGWVCISYDRNPHVGVADDPTVHYALAYIGSGVALASYCGRLVAGRLAGAADETGPLLGTTLPRIPVPALRRLYQRAAYAWYGFQDEWL